MIYFILMLTLASGEHDNSRRFDDRRACYEWASWLVGVHERQNLTRIVAARCQGVREVCKANPTDWINYEFCNEMLNGEVP